MLNQVPPPSLAMASHVLVLSMIVCYDCAMPHVLRLSVNAPFEFVEVEIARGDGVSVEDPSFEGVDGLEFTIIASVMNRDGRDWRGSQVGKTYSQSGQLACEFDEDRCRRRVVAVDEDSFDAAILPVTLVSGRRF